MRSSFDDDGSTSGNAIVVDVEVAVENNKLSFIGDGSFEEMMKERNRVSFTCLSLRKITIICLYYIIRTISAYNPLHTA